MATTNQVPGGKLKKLASNSYVAEGNTHAQGGIKIANNAEVENNEIITNNKDNTTSIFSNNLGYAKIAKQLAKKKGELEQGVVEHDAKINKLRDNTSTDPITKNTLARQIQVRSLAIGNNLNQINKIDDGLNKLVQIQETEKELKGLAITDQKYGFGDWLLGGVETVGGAALIASGVGAPLGLGLMASGVGTIASGIASDDANNAAQNELNQNLALAQQEQQAQLANTNAYRAASDKVFANYKPIAPVYTSYATSAKAKNGGVYKFDIGAVITQNYQDITSLTTPTAAPANTNTTTATASNAPISTVNADDVAKLTAPGNINANLATASTYNATNANFTNLNANLNQVGYDVTGEQAAIRSGAAANNAMIMGNTSSSSTARTLAMQNNQNASLNEAQVLQNQTNQENAQRASNVGILNQTAQINQQGENQFALTNAQVQNQASQFNASNKTNVSLANAQSLNQTAQFNEESQMKTQEYNDNAANQNLYFNAQAQNQGGQFNASANNQTSMFNSSQLNSWNQNMYNQSVNQNTLQEELQLQNLNTIYGKYGGKYSKLAKLGYGGIIDQYYSNVIGATDKYDDFMIQKYQKQADTDQKMANSMLTSAITMGMSGQKLPGVNNQQSLVSQLYNNYQIGGK